MRGLARVLLAALACALIVLLASCQQQITSPKPKISKLVPANTDAGKPAFALEVDGSQFTPASIVTWNGQPRTTTFVTTSELNAEIFATDIQNAGTATIAVETLPPGGGTTKSLTFTINAVQSSVPQISSISPTGVTAGNASFTLTVQGSGFVPQSTVRVNGNIRTTAFESTTELLASVLSTDVATAGNLQIAVVNPPPGGGSSSFVSLPVRNPVPFLSTLAPTAILAGSAASSLGITGTGFVPDSVVTVNGAARTTTFSSTTSLQASLTAGDFANATVLQVRVVNPADGGSGGGTSNVAPFAVNATELAGLPVIVDLAPDGSQANNGICGATCPGGGAPTLTTAGPSASQSGEFIAYASSSTNLITTPPIITSSAIFLRDTCFSTSVTIGGSSGCIPKTTLVSIAPGGALANGPSTEPSLDSAGTHLAFTSTASNLVNYVVVSGTKRQVYWETACTTTTGIGACSSGTATAALVSISADGSSAGNGDSFNPVISADGRYVAFASLATNLLATPPLGGFDGVTPQVFIRDTCSVVPPQALGGCTPTTYLVSVSPDGTAAGDGASSHPAIANTGLFVSFASNATNLITGSNPSALSQIFERSTCVTTIGGAGNTCAAVTSLISTPDGVTPADDASIEPSISTDGRYVVFASKAQNLIPGVGPTQEIYLRDTCTGVAVTTPATCTPSIVLVSTEDGTPQGSANGLSENPSIGQCSSTTTTTTVACATGQSIAFASLASNLTANVENGVENIFVRNPCLNVPATSTTNTSGCVTYTLLASQLAGTAPPPADGKSVAPAVSGDGHTVSFISFADNLVPNDSNALEDIFLAGAIPTFGLSLTVADTNNAGSGTVTDGTGQISCSILGGTNGGPATVSGTCTGRYLSGTAVTLTATATPQSTFVGWSGSVIGPNCIANTSTDTTCTFAAVHNNTATATFDAK